jgi:hypothetical protein
MSYGCGLVGGSLLWILAIASSGRRVIGKPQPKKPVPALTGFKTASLVESIQRKCLAWAVGGLLESTLRWQAAYCAGRWETFPAGLLRRCNE